MNLNRTIHQVKCIKNKIVKKIRDKTFKTFPKKVKPEYSYYPSQLQTDFESSKIFEIEKFKSKFNFSQIEQKLNISGKLNTLKKKFLRFVQLEDCFEVEEEKYGFRSKVTLVENSPCILGSTCRGVPDDESNAQSTLVREKLDLNSIWDNPYLDRIRIRSDNLDRQTGEEFASDGPPDCRVVRSTQCKNDG
jgi:hypothetical protein